MKLVSKNLKQGAIKLTIETPEDIWHVSQLVDEGDLVKGKTTRKIKINEQADATKRNIFVAIRIEKIEYSKSTHALRLNGKIEEGPEDVPLGSYQSLSIEPGTTLTIIKSRWYGYQLDRLQEALESTAQRILVCVFDREDAYFALIKPSGSEILTHIKGEVAKKRMPVTIQTPFYAQIIKQLEDYDKRYNLDTIVLASPSFWKEELNKTLTNAALKKKIIPTSCSAANERAIDEVLKKDDVQHALSAQRSARELRFVEEALTELSKNGLVAYGMPSVSEAANAGAIKTLLVSDNLIQHLREEERFADLNTIMQTVDSQKGTVVVISGDHEGGQKLDGIGGICALLRYKL